MNTPLQNILSRFTNNETIERFRGLMHSLRAAQKTPRTATHKPFFTCGFRGFPRTMTRPGSVSAPTIDEVRRLERAYMCKLRVMNGLIYFQDGTVFTHERGRNYRHNVMTEMVEEVS